MRSELGDEARAWRNEVASSMRERGAGHSGCVSDKRETWIGADVVGGGEGERFDLVVEVLALARFEGGAVTVAEDEDDALFDMISYEIRDAAGERKEPGCAVGSRMIEAIARRANMPLGSSAGVERRWAVE